MKKKLALSIVLAAAFLAVAASRVDGERFREAMTRLEGAWLAPVFLLQVLAQLLRCVRWWRIVRPVRSLPLARVSTTAVAGFLAIVVFPLRAGEVVRPLLLKGRDGVPFSAGLATVVAERVVDALAVFVMLLASLAVVPARTVHVGGYAVELQAAARLLLVIFVPAALFLLALVVLRGRLVTIVERLFLPLSPRLGALAARVLGSFAVGLELFRSPALALQVGALTAGVWGLQIASFGVAFRAFGIDLPASAALPVLAVTMAGITVPGGIGMSGNFQLFCVAALALYGVDGSLSLAYSIVLNVLGVAVVLAMGLPVLPFLSVRLSDLAARGEDALQKA